MSTINLATLMVLLKLNSQEYEEGTEKAKKKTVDLEKMIGGALVGALTVAAAAAVKFGKESVAEFQTFEKGIKEVYTLLPGISQDAMKQMEGDVLSFGKEVGRTSDEVVPALYQAISAGVPQENVFDFMKIASDAALGGVTDLETAVDGITSVVNAYGSEVIDASAASDVMFTAVRLGKTNFEELSNSLFNVVPTAASLGVTFEDVAANLAALTAAGTPTSVATTQLRQAFVEASKSGTALDQALRDLHGKGFADLIASGMTSAQIFGSLRDSMPEQDFKDLFGSVEAVNAALGITNGTADGVIESFGGLEDTVGATAEAAATMAGSLEHLEAKAAAATEAFKIQAGEALEPLKRSYLEAKIAAFEFADVNHALNQALAEGQITSGDLNRIQMKMAFTSYDAADAMTELEDITTGSTEATRAYNTAAGEFYAKQAAAAAATADVADEIDTQTEAMVYNDTMMRSINRTIAEFNTENGLLLTATGQSTRELEEMAYATGELGDYQEAMLEPIRANAEAMEAEAEAARIAAEAQREHQAALGGYFDSALQAGDGAATLEEQLYASAQAAGAGATELAILAAATGNFTDEEIEAAFQAALMTEQIKIMAQQVAEGSLTADDAVAALKRLQDGTADSAEDAANLAQNAADAASELDGLSGKAIDAAGNLAAIPSNIPVHISITSDPIPAMPVGPGSGQPGKQQAHKEGGFTGWGGVDDIAGVVHGQEFVFSAPAVRAIGLPMLEMLHAQGVQGGGDNFQGTVNNNFYGPADATAVGSITKDAQLTAFRRKGMR